MEPDSALPPVFRDRLYELFSQIELEFENLYFSKLELQERVRQLTDQLDLEGEHPDKHTLHEHQDSTDGLNKHKLGNQLSQRIKTTYRQSTNRLVSSFRSPNRRYKVVRHFKGHRDGVWEIDVSRSPGRAVIGSASADYTAKIFCIESSACLINYVGHKGSVNSFRFHPSQHLVLTASGDNSVHIWAAPWNQVNVAGASKSHSSGEDEIDTSEKEEAAYDGLEHTSESGVVRGPEREILLHTDVVSAADWLGQGSQVVTASWDRTALVVDAESGEKVSELSGHDLELTNVHAHASQGLVLTSSKDTTFRLWDLRSPAMLVNVFQGHTQPVSSVVFTLGDKVISGSDDRSVKVWDMRNMRSPSTTIRTDSEVNRLAVSQNIIAIPQDNRHISLYNIHGGRVGRLPRSNSQGHSKMVCAVAWAEANSTCQLFSCGFDRQILGWLLRAEIKD